MRNAQTKDTDRELLATWRTRGMLDVGEVSTITGLGRATIFRLLAAGKLAGIRVGKRRGVRPEALIALLDAAEVGV